MRRVGRILTVVGGAVAVLTLSKIHARYIASPPYDLTASARLAWGIGYAFFLAVAAYAAGLPDQARSVREAGVSGFASALAGAVGVSVIQLAIGDALLPRFVVFGTVLAMIPIQIAANALARRGQRRGESRDRVLLVSSNADHEHLVDDLRLAPERAASVVAALRVAEAEGTPGTAPLRDAQRATDATVVVLDRSALATDRIVAQAAELHEAGVRVRSLEAFYAEWLGKLPLSELERASLFFDIGEVHGSRYGRLKRLLDLLIGSVGALALVVVTPVVLVGNAIANRGSLLYRQQRVGKGGRAFTIVKFRSMTESHASEWTAPDDPRVTPFGGFLRRSHLDELPQVLNILRGDLAVVGPRPEQPRYVAELSDKLAFYDLRHLVRPGLTGWAQVKYGYAGDERDALEKLQYEFFYLRNQDLWFDARVIVRTVRSMVGGDGAGR